jgi:hypothetical protein
VSSIASSGPRADREGDSRLNRRNLHLERLRYVDLSFVGGLGNSERHGRSKPLSASQHASVSQSPVAEIRYVNARSFMIPPSEDTKFGLMPLSSVITKIPASPRRGLCWRSQNAVLALSDAMGGRALDGFFLAPGSFAASQTVKTGGHLFFGAACCGICGSFRSYRQRMSFEPQRTGGAARVNPGLPPPCRFIAAAVGLTMVASAQWDNKFVTDFPPQSPALREAQMVRILRAPTANQTRLLGDIPNVVSVSNPARLWQGQRCLIKSPSS